MIKAGWWEIMKFSFKKPFVRKVDSIKDFGFGSCWKDGTRCGYKEGEYVSAPMESGKRAILNLYKIETPSDPGDQHFFHWEFIKYV